MAEITPADISAVTRPYYGENGMGFGNEGLWLFAILALFGFGGNGFFGGRGAGYPTDIARQSDVYQTSAFNQLQDENRGIISEIQRVGYDNMTNVKDVAYNNLSEIRDLEGIVNQGFANQQICCCNTLRAIDGTDYKIATESAKIQATSTANAQRILDYMTARDNTALRDRVQTLELQQAMSGVVKYPAQTAYAVPSPCFGFGNGGCSTI